jgi:hypothetical protein
LAEEQEGRRHPEGHHVRQAVQLLAQFAAATEGPGRQTIEYVEQRAGEHQPTRQC